MWNQFVDGYALLFTVPAVIGSFVLLLKLGLLTFGGDSGDADVDVDVDVDLDVDMDVDFDADVNDAAHAHGGDDLFVWLSVQGIAALLAGFGWGGLVGTLTFHWELPASLALGIGAGGFLMWLAGMLFRFVMSLQESGTVSITRAMGCVGDVYAGIPATGSGRGQVRVIIDNRARFYNADTEGEALATGTRIKVVRINNDRSVTVMKA
jgi:hypothetical protein